MQFVGLKVLDSNGAGKTSDVIRAIEFAIANKQHVRHRHHQPVARPPDLRAGRDRPAGAGGREGDRRPASSSSCPPATTASNENGELGFAGITSPGNAPSALTVGASDHKATVTRDDDAWRVYSSSGPTWYDGLVKPDVVAPGHFLASEAAPRSSLFKTYPSLRKKGKSGKDFMQLSGTSMAAGVATGVVALLKQATPST